MGSLTAHQQITDGQTYQTSYNYDSFGRMISETYPSMRTVKVDYNADGDVSSVWGTVGSQNRLYANGFHYNSSGAMERMRLGNGKWETYAYNERQQITEIALGNSATDKSLLKLEYGYGNNTQNNGNLLSQKVSFNGLSQPFEQTYPMIHSTVCNRQRKPSAAFKIRRGNRLLNMTATASVDLTQIIQPHSAVRWFNKSVEKTVFGRILKICGKNTMMSLSKML